MTCWIMPLLIVDLAFLPMFHIWGLPFKISYLAIGLLFLRQVYVGNNSTRGLARELTVLFALLITFSLMGTLVFLMVYRGTHYAQSIRNVIVYFLAPMAFVAGVSDVRRKHNYIFVCILVYFGLTVLLSVLPHELGWLIRFYGLEERMTSGLYGIRNQGLFFNANVSALTMTMLFLWFISGVKYGYVRVRSSSIIIVIGAVFSTITILLSRNQILAVGILVLFFLRAMWKRKGFRVTVALLITGALLLLVFHAQLETMSRAYLGYSPLQSLKRGFSSIADYSDASGSLLRPAMRFSEAWARFRVSPLVGTGFDMIDIKPFEGTSYHNDWLYILTSSGVLGLSVFAIIVYRLARLDLVLIVPFLLPGMTNSFIYAPSHFLLLMLLAGAIWRRKLEDARSPSNVRDDLCFPQMCSEK